MHSQKIPFYKFAIQAIFSSVILVFCLYQLGSQGRGKRVNESLYSSILSGIAGYWLPSPTGRRSDGDAGVSIDGDSTTVINNPDK